MKAAFAPFDAADYLDNDVVVAEYLTAAAEDPNPGVFLAALGDVAKAKGMAKIARDSGLGRESLYKSLESGAHPRYETVAAVLKALGVKFEVVAIPAATAGATKRRQLSEDAPSFGKRPRNKVSPSHRQRLRR